MSLIARPTAPSRTAWMPLDTSGKAVDGSEDGRSEDRAVHPEVVRELVARLLEHDAGEERDA